MGTEGPTERAAPPRRALDRIRNAMSRRLREQREEGHRQLLGHLEMLELDRLQNSKPGLALLAAAEGPVDGELDDAFVESYLSARRRAGAPAEELSPAITPELLEPKQTLAEDPLKAMERRGVDPLWPASHSTPPLARGLVPNLLGELCGEVLERSNRIGAMVRGLRRELHTALPAADWHVQENVIVDGVIVPFLVIGTRGITAIWVDDGDDGDDVANQRILSQIARRGLERRLPDGRPVTVWHWGIRADGRNGRRWCPVGPGVDDGYWYVRGGNPELFRPLIAERETRWPLPAGIGDVVRAASRVVPTAGQPKIADPDADAHDL